MKNNVVPLAAYQPHANGLRALSRRAANLADNIDRMADQFRRLHTALEEHKEVLERCKVQNQHVLKALESGRIDEVERVAEELRERGCRR